MASTPVAKTVQQEEWFGRLVLAVVRVVTYVLTMPRDFMKGNVPDGIDAVVIYKILRLILLTTMQSNSSCQIFPKSPFPLCIDEKWTDDEKKALCTYLQELTQRLPILAMPTSAPVIAVPAHPSQTYTQVFHDMFSARESKPIAKEPQPSLHTVLQDLSTQPSYPPTGTVPVPNELLLKIQEALRELSKRDENEKKPSASQSSFPNVDESDDDDSTYFASTRHRSKSRRM